MKIVLAITVLLALASILVSVLAFIQQDWIIFAASTMNVVSMSANSFLFYRRIQDD